MAKRTAADWFAWLVVRLRHVIVVAWIAAAVAAAVALPNLREAQTGSFGDLVPNDAAAIDAELRSNELFGFPLLSRTVVVQRDPQGISLGEQAQVVGHARALIRGQYPGLTGVAAALPITNLGGLPPFAREEDNTALTYLFFPPTIGEFGQTSLAERFVERHVRPQAEGFVGVTGALPARVAQFEAIQEALPLVELATVLLVTAVVGLHFRAMGAPAANLVTVGVAYVVAVRAMAWAGERLGVSVPSEIEPVVVALLFGVITDYVIFFLSRFRRRLRGGEAPLVAVERATAELLPIILACGLTVIGAGAALSVAQLGFFQVFGPAIAMSVLVGLLVSITLVPAMLGVAGGRIFWPSRPEPAAPPEDPRRQEAPPRRWARGRVVAFASRHPAPSALACTVLLLGAATGLLQLQLGNPLIRGLPDDAVAKQAYAAAQRGFAPGILSPTVILVESEGIAERRDALARLGRLVGRQPGVATVVGPGSSPGSSPFGVVLSRTGDAARYAVVLGVDPLGARAIAAVQSLQARMPALLDAAGLSSATASFAGDTALVAETVSESGSDLARVTPVALIVVFAVLAVFLRALVAPLYLLAASVLALAAALGLTTYVFQDGLGFGELTYYVPFAVAVLLVALGSDYNVFLAGRIWREARERPLREAVAVGGSLAATPITIAGIVLGGSFGLLALVPIRPFRELAFAMSAGLVLDAFLVRTILVPALIALVGERSGWPGGRLARPEVDPAGT